MKKGNYSKRKGNRYEVQIVNELKELGYDAVTARSESKNTDDKKIDIISEKCPVYIQTKQTQATPSYHKIREQCPLKDKPFVIFWKKQVHKAGNKNITSEEDLVLVPKKFFYKLLKKYK